MLPNKSSRTLTGKAPRQGLWGRMVTEINRNELFFILEEADAQFVQLLAGGLGGGV